MFFIKGQDGCGMIKDDTVVKDHMDREFHILEELQMDDYDRKMTYDNWGVDNPYYRREDCEGIEHSLKIIRRAQIQQRVEAHRISQDLLTRNLRKPMSRKDNSNMQHSNFSHEEMMLNINSDDYLYDGEKPPVILEIDAAPTSLDAELDLINEEQMKEFETNSAHEACGGNPTEPLELQEMDDCVSQTKSADDVVEEPPLDCCDEKNTPNPYGIPYAESLEQMTTMGGLTEAPSKQGMTSNHGDLISDFQITASLRHRSFSQDTELVTVTDHHAYAALQRKTSMMFVEATDVNEEIEHVERRSNKSHQPEIDEDNQIQLPENLEDLERADRLTEIAYNEDVGDVDNDLPVPNDEIEPPPPSGRKVEVFDDYIETPSEVVSPDTQMFGSFVTGAVA